MLSLIRGTLVVFVAACSIPPQRYTAADHERAAAHYDATPDAIATECWKARRNELTVNDPDPCWKAEDIRFLDANRNAADQQRAQAAQIRALEARRQPPPHATPAWIP
jgi:hypothetical protein